jgi:hypothetical protein
MMVVRAGAHTGAFDQHRRYRKPRSANPSSTGVFANESPKHPMCGPISSHVIHKTFGRPAACAPNTPAATPPKKLRLVIPDTLLCKNHYVKWKSIASG